MGSSIPAIENFILQKHKEIDIQQLKVQVRIQIRQMVNEGLLQKRKSSYLLGEKSKKKNLKVQKDTLNENNSNSKIQKKEKQMTKDIEDNLMKDVEKSKKKKKTEAKKAPKPEISKNEKKFELNSLNKIPKIKGRIYESQIQLVQQALDIEKIFHSRSLDDESKTEKLYKVKDQLSHRDLNYTLKSFRVGLYYIIQKYLGDCITLSQMALLSVAQLVIQKTMPRQNENEYFFEIQNTGLLDKIKYLIKQKIDDKQEKNQDDNDVKIIKDLIQVYMIIMVDQKIDLEMIGICAQIMNQDVANILEWDNLDEHEQEQRALALYEVYKGESLNELKKKFDYWTLVCIQKRIGNCSTGTERILIDIIELVAQRGVLTSIKYPFHQTDLLFQDDHRIELFEKIRFLTIGKFYEVDEQQGRKLIPL
ncbi:MAG: hypothetical protein EZS28_026549 [Streblomastix strix]|uniref:H15 domain-containing protein n=1 Tax=Streblomastix strix TaxID=222440 RepID=A0A5J4V4T3_9EUKA|nr:MAG: hypothetical protein EZS28_026549 [Streblomastix strix]